MTPASWISRRNLNEPNACRPQKLFMSPPVPRTPQSHLSITVRGYTQDERPYEPRNPTRRPAAEMANPAGVRDYLFRVGLDFLRHPRGSARGAAAAAGGHALFCGGPGALQLAAAAWHAGAQPAGVGERLASRG